MVSTACIEIAPWGPSGRGQVRLPPPPPPPPPPIGRVTTGLSALKKTTRVTQKEFGAKTNGIAKNNECTSEDAKMRKAKVCEGCISTRLPNVLKACERERERYPDNVNRNENCCHRLTVPATRARALITDPSRATSSHFLSS